MKASGAFSNPSAMVSRQVILPALIHVAMSRMKSGIMSKWLLTMKPRMLTRKQALHTAFLEHIAEAGFARETVDMVVCTHLHVDHVGWNTMLDGGKWVPTFPNARYLIGKTEYEHWQKAPEGETADIMADSVTPIFDAGLAQTVEMDHRISQELRLVPTPGHTPGHVSVAI